jgi:hypothetical protein
MAAGFAEAPWTEVDASRDVPQLLAIAFDVKRG